MLTDSSSVRNTTYLLQHEKAEEFVCNAFLAAAPCQPLTILYQGLLNIHCCFRVFWVSNVHLQTSFKGIEIIMSMTKINKHGLPSEKFPNSLPFLHHFFANLLLSGVAFSVSLVCQYWHWSNKTAESCCKSGNQQLLFRVKEGIVLEHALYTFFRTVTPELFSPFSCNYFNFEIFRTRTRCLEVEIIVMFP